MGHHGSRTHFSDERRGVSLQSGGVAEGAGVFDPERECGRREEILCGEQGGAGVAPSI